VEHVSVIVPVRNEEAQIGRTLEALLANSYPSFEILVVDDASTDATRSSVEAFCASGRVRLIHNGECVGPSRATNLAARQTGADFLFLIDGDCTPAADWIEQGARSLRTTGVCAVEGAVYYAEPRPTFRHRVPINPFYNLARRGPLTVPQTDYANTSFAVRRDAFLAVGGFNEERYPYGREDTDLGLRLRRLGRIVYNPDMKVTHKVERWTLRDLLRNARRYEADVRILKDYGDFHYRWRRLMHPRFLAELCFPFLIPLRYPMRSIADLLFVPEFCIYLAVLRLFIWRSALREGILVL
jgi:GT2 family glycosyltransferase